MRLAMRETRSELRFSSQSWLAYRCGGSSSADTCPRFRSRPRAGPHMAVGAASALLRCGASPAHWGLRAGLAAALVVGLRNATAAAAVDAARRPPRGPPPPPPCAAPPRGLALPAAASRSSRARSGSSTCSSGDGCCRHRARRHGLEAAPSPTLMTLLPKPCAVLLLVSQSAPFISAAAAEVDLLLTIRPG